MSIEAHAEGRCYYQRDYSEVHADRILLEQGWVVMEDKLEGRSVRRVSAPPGLRDAYIGYTRETIIGTVDAHLQAHFLYDPTRWSDVVLANREDENFSTLRVSQLNMGHDEIPLGMGRVVFARRIPQE